MLSEEAQGSVAICGEEVEGRPESIVGRERGKPTEVPRATHINLKNTVLEEEGKRECPYDTAQFT